MRVGKNLFHTVRDLRKLLIGEILPDIYSIRHVANEHALSYQGRYIDILKTMFTALIRSVYFEKEWSNKTAFSNATIYLDSFSSETLQHEETNQDYYQHLSAP